MTTRSDVSTFFTTRYRTYLPHVSVDCVIFGFHDADLKLLLLKWKGKQTWALPGGFVRRRESLDAAAHRVLRERTGLRSIHLQQFHAFGGIDRNEADLRRLFAALGVKAPRRAWPLERVVSIGYYALVDFSKVTPKVDYLSDTCAWQPLDDRPRLAFDHDDIVAKALQALRARLGSDTLEVSLLPDQFTMPELQRLHEAILGRPLDRRNFQKKMIERTGIERLSKRRVGGAHRSPYLYRFGDGKRPR
jgi:8-oxo-dGTP diphosphatase